MNPQTICQEIASSTLDLDQVLLSAWEGEGGGYYHPANKVETKELDLGCWEWEGGASIHQA